MNIFEIGDMDPKSSLQTIPVLRDFWDVFPDDLPCMLLKREVEFSIDLLPGTTPIFKALYRMGHVELQELGS